MAVKTMYNTVSINQNGIGKFDSISQTLTYELSDPKTRTVPDFVHEDQVLDYLCVFCEKVAVNEPHQALLCACRMCHSCVQNYLKECESTNQEPFCKGKTDDCKDAHLSFTNKRLNRVVRDRAAINDLELLEVRCPNHKAGCDWVGTWKQSHEHVNDECEWVTSICKDCGSEVQRKMMDKHLSEVCPKRTLNCQYCGAEMTAEVLDGHLDKECKMNNETCDLCSQSVRKHLMSDHKESMCSKRLVHCEFAQWGCDFHDAYDKLEAHNQSSNNTHLKMMMLNMKSGGGQTSVGQNELQELKLKIKKLEEEIQNLRASLHHLQDSGLLAGAQPQGSPLAQQVEKLNEMFDRLNSEVTELRSKTNASNNGTQRTEAQTTEAQDSQAVAAVDSGDGDGDSSELRSVSRIGQQLDMTSFSGILIWKLPGFRAMREEAQRGGRKQYYDSPPFFTSKFGYKMMARVYPNGDGSGRNTHLSLFFVLLRGEFDDLLAWPFRQKVTFVLLDQDTSNPKNVIDTFRPDPNSACFRKPSSDMNLASGCPSFVPRTVLDSKPSSCRTTLCI